MATSVDPAAVLASIVEGYVKLPLTQKVLVPLLIVGSIFGIIFVSRYANQPDYVVLFSDLEPADASAVVERLKEQKIKYEVRGDGSTVAISPPEMVQELRIALASEGVPKRGTIGWEIFDQTSFGATSLVEKMKLVRGTQGELERTISALEAVLSARVHITQPERTLFAKNKVEATASVLLKLRPGGELEKKQIKGIVNLVAGSVEGLKRENVTIVDIFGNLLTPDEKGADELGPDATRLQYVKEVEKSYVERIEQMLTKVLGPGKVIARVSADLDFAMNEREEEAFDSGGQVLRSERSVEEGAGGSQRGGVPGVVSNLTNDPNLLSPPSAANESSSRKEKVKNYEVSRAVIKTAAPRGRLVRLSAAVLVDGTYDEVPAEPTKDKAAAAEAKPKKVFRQLEPEVVSQVESLVRSAIGYDPSRGDTVTVENIPFYTADGGLEEILEKDATMNTVAYWVRMIVPIIFVILFFLTLVRPLVRFLVTPTDAEVDLSRLLPTGIQELEAELDAERSKAQIPAFEPAVDLEQLGEMLAENSRLVKENPQQAALLIRYWLNDGRI